MKKLSIALCIAGTALTLAACENTNSHHSGASYANERTAGNQEYTASKRSAPERVFRKEQVK